MAVEEAEAEAVEGMTTTRAVPHPLPSRVFPGVYDYETDDVEATVFSTTPKCNNNWLKSYKIKIGRAHV